MPVQFLTDEQRRQYARFTRNPSSDELARYFHLDEADREIIGNLRGDHNRLGFALMLCAARFIGVFPGQETDIPKSVLVRLRRQLDIEAVVTLDDYFAGWRRIRHVALIREKYGFSDYRKRTCPPAADPVALYAVLEWR